jgi:quercetin dioxygenase-like cupin family protein
MSYPKVIESGGGEQITFLRLVKDGAGERLEVENPVQPGAGPPMHVHYKQEENLTVVSGKLGYQCLGEQPRFATKGETVRFEAGVTHRFWNAGPDALRCSGFARPANNLEYFLTELYRSTKVTGGRRPDPFDAAFLATRYKTEFGMAAIPAPVQAVLFPLLLVIGRLTGKFKKFADAPAPLP